MQYQIIFDFRTYQTELKRLSNIISLLLISN